MVIDVLAVLAGAAIVVVTIASAVATVVVPRGVPVRLTLVVFLGMRRAFDLPVRWARHPDRADHLLAHYAPLSLLALMGTWLTLVGAGFTLVFWGLGVGSLTRSFEASGSAVTTLGFVPLSSAPQQAAAFVEAALGLLVLALLVTYLPSMYAAFQRREALVSLAAMQAGTPATGVGLLVRFHDIRGFDALEGQVWQPWTLGFVDIEESHTSLAALPFFRSPQPDRSWITAAGAILDAASLLASTVDIGRQPAAELCIRSGYLSLRRIADQLDLPYDPDPSRGDPILVSRQEWEDARLALAATGIAVRGDVDEAWLDFAGWRVNYDSVLVGIAGLVAAPIAPWSSDRVPARRHRPRIRRRRW
jgi:hypothetical protein